MNYLHDMNYDFTIVLYFNLKLNGNNVEDNNIIVIFLMICLQGSYVYIHPKTRSSARHIVRNKFILS